MRKNSWIYFFGIFFSIVMLACAGYAEEPHIFSAGIKLTVGLEQNFVLKKLRETYKVVKHDSDKKGNESWLVHDPKTNKLVAQIGFQNGALIWASHEWDSFSDDKSFSLAKSLYALVSNVNESEKTSASIITKTVRSPRLTVDDIRINFKNKQILITIIQGDNQQTVQINESVFR